jgi:hypothetical protein
MFDNLIAQWKAEKQAKELLKDPVVAMARTAALHYWVNNKQIAGKFSQQFVQGQFEGMMQRAIEAAFAPDPVAKNREFMVGTMYETSIYEHIVLSNPKTQDVNGYKTLPGVSGALWPYLRSSQRRTKSFVCNCKGCRSPQRRRTTFTTLG